jgi:hypothetical protein
LKNIEFKIFVDTKGNNLRVVAETKGSEPVFALQIK